LSECADCQAALDVLDAEVNRPFACLRAPAPATADWMEPTFRQLVEHAKALNHDDVAFEPRTLGNYRLLEIIGKGGFGVVYKAMHERLKKTVVVKLLAPGHADSADNRARFQREMEAVGQLASPHIIAAHDAGEIDGQLLLVMEYVDGRTLSEVVRQDGPLPLDRALDCVLQAARGLAHAHAAGIVHRDVKPSNLLLDTNGTVKVLDLGLARFLFEASSETAMMGTPIYMAPELFDGRVADERADIYSLGCTMYHLITGRFLYRSDDWREIVAGHCNGPIPDLPDCPRAVNDLFRRLVAKKPEDRPASMQAVVDELEKIAGKKAVKRTPGHAMIAATIVIAASLLLTLTLWLSGGFLGDQKKDNGVAQPKRGATPEITMVLIVAGDFFMGASDSDPRAKDAEKPRQKIKINKAFYLGKTEVTQAQYEEVVGTNPSAFSKNGASKARVKDVDTTKHPVESVSWLDACLFCNKLSERHGLTPYYKIDHKEKVVTIQGGAGYRLPTEAEWEYGCRAGTMTTWHFGEKQAELTDHAWFAENSSDRTHPVGQKKPNAWGLHDMLGNVPEWCWDRYDPDYYGSYRPASDPPGSKSGRFRAIRGDAWNTLLPRSSAREGLGFTYGGAGSINIVGFRVARNAE
jgi:formylglycine-generating enzyme required for sulfatase activity/tRNA A-37 threonylcarbamoyl transferase component Bud32